ncbi:Fe-S protein assembly co-chaperone HscB [Buchnera aphidicola (Hyadaphis tataricae)]|uniref:Co-chaperone protein HscB n=1 Tax=Buchnera aphidicola (Hyadaphis tataricae) TaxID=1241859 RepID=A0A4D6XWD7_9GAMM|nr:Fe-S protein assembly co-chaperone HscB [Buchnera aphidicola]QCI21866.1 Fe-S protein assembly co-chaperone HscB [Buchnera aphidicola (Hyadaphis tataricae)]
MDYFTLFNMPKTFKINERLLSKNFYQLQLQFHPDLFINDSSIEKSIILKKSIEINKGYKILKNFLSRAIYLLSLHGLMIKKEKLFSNNNPFLKDYFLLHEELDDLKKNAVNKEKLDKFLEKIEKKAKQYEDRIEVEFNQKNFDKIIQIIERLLFFENLKNSLKKIKIYDDIMKIKGY